MGLHFPKKWDAIYDVIVLGYGGAGATAARFAADKGAKVLLVDSAPEGKEGGNTRVCGQIIGSGDDVNELKSYEIALNAPFHVDDNVIDTLVHGMTNISTYIKKYFGVSPYSYKKQCTGDSVLLNYIQEYPELPGASTFDLKTVKTQYKQSALWKLLKKEVDKRTDKIDVWYGSPAKHLIQDQFTKAVIGAQVERDHKVRSIKARRGVILTTGGFENSAQKMNDFLQEPYLTSIGTVYNKGDGIDMAMEVGADLCHLRSYESLGLSIKTQKNNHGIGTLGVIASSVFNGSIIAVGDDGTRYFKEDENNRHGHIYNHGMYRIPFGQMSPYMIFDQKQAIHLTKARSQGKLIIDPLKYAINADKIEELAKKIGKDVRNISTTISDFNFFCDQGKDYAYHRDPNTMQKFADEGPYYAVPLTKTMLNTQGGPRRNANAEIVDPDGDPIPHLYGAGELGAPYPNQYAGGSNIADCLIFGKIAGENAAKEKSPLTASGESNLINSEQTSDFVATSDNKKKDSNFSVGANQYLGYSKAGMGDELVVRVTVDTSKSIKNIEVLKESETEQGSEALLKLPKEMIAKNTYEVDAVSGASATSNALRDAVKDALSKIENK